jgi:hypothetical protein
MSVQEQLRAVVADKIVETQQRTSDFIGFLGQLQQMAAWLAGPPVAGACDDTCACTTDPATVGAAEGWVAATLIPAIHTTGDVPIACTLGPDNMDERIATWQTVTATALAREALDGGVRVRLPRSTDLAALGQLIDDEQTCCAFFTFTLTVTSDAVLLDMHAPEDALPLAYAVVGAPA